jgi:uncharacterized protein YdhG (YjbR/CyaY superfamily)
VARTSFQSFDEYAAAQPRSVAVVLRRVRAIIRKAVPGAVEVISYQMPAYKVAGRVFLYLGAWKEHYSLYPASDAMVAFLGALAPYRTSKGTLRFAFSEPVPTRLIAGAAAFRAREVAALAKVRRLEKKKGR